MPEFNTIRYDVDDHILTLTLNRPERLNAFTQLMRDELLDAIEMADDDDNIRAVIFTGEGRGFCAGADLARGGDTFDHSTRDKSTDRFPDRDGGGTLTLRLYDAKKPLIAAINGPAVGIGITMTLPMDIRLAADNARFGFVFARRAIVPEAASSWFLPRLVGPQQALEWMLSGRVFDADEALAGGLVRSVHPQAELMDAARGIAREIADNTAPVSVALTRQMVWKMLTENHPMAAHRVDTAGVRYCGQLDDAREGVESFMAKRPPEFGNSPSGDMPDYYPWWNAPEFGPPKF